MSDDVTADALAAKIRAALSPCLYADSPAEADALLAEAYASLRQLELALRMCARELAVLRQGVDALAYLPAAVEADVDDVVQEFLQKATGFGSEEAT